MANSIGKNKKKKRKKIGYKKKKKKTLFFLFIDKNELEMEKLKKIICPRSVSTQSN